MAHDTLLIALVVKTDDLIRSHFDVFLNLNQRLAEMRRIFSLATVFLSAVTFDVTMATSGIIGSVAMAPGNDVRGS